MSLLELQRLLLDTARIVQEFVEGHTATLVVFSVLLIVCRTLHPILTSPFRSVVADRLETGNHEPFIGEFSDNRGSINKDYATSSNIMSPVRTYVLGHRMGVGDLCDVHYGVSRENEYILRVPRNRGGNHLLAKEQMVLEELIEQSRDDPYRLYFPEPVESFHVQRRQINVSQWREGFFTSEQILDRYPYGIDGRHLAWMFNRTLESLGYVHSKGWIHGAVLPPHLMFHPESHGLQLVGWIHAERSHRTLRIAPTRFKTWYPVECRQKKPATPSVDIYLAAKSMVYLAGGDPISNSIPERIPVELRRFLKGCLLESVRMRPQNAWELHEEFNELLEVMYGLPKFHPLDIS